MKIAYISTSSPRPCGIATFNNNLLNAIDHNTSLDSEQYVVAINDSESFSKYNYGEEVKVLIRQHHKKDYIRAAEYINGDDSDVCVLEHEFGIFGGEDGSDILHLTSRLSKPLTVIFHTVLKEPSNMQRTIIREIARSAQKIVVMSHKAVGFLMDIYGIPPDKIKMIHHGVPDFNRPVISAFYNDETFKNKTILMTFGLIGRNKGLETVIKALPEIIKTNPDVIYLILGSTHPSVLQQEGDSYRDSLVQLAKDLRVENNVVFINKFASDREVHQYLSSCDIYITPYPHEAQITSGALSYAVGAGAAVVSTPYWHAQELLAGGRGMLFDFNDDVQLSATINDLIDNKATLTSLKHNAYEFGKKIRWTLIGEIYYNMFEEIMYKNIDIEISKEITATLGGNYIPRLALTAQSLNNESLRSKVS